MTDEYKTNLLTVEKLRNFLYDKPADANVFVHDDNIHEAGDNQLTTKVRLHFYDGDVTIEAI